jgi:ribokinase
LLAKGVKTVIITLGEKGFLLATKDSKEMIANHQVTAVDSTAAGDAFIGGVACGIASGKSTKEAAVYANVVAAISVTRLGAQPSMPSKEEVDALIHLLNKQN